MNTKLKYLFFIFYFFQCSSPLLAQSTYQLGGLPSLNFNKKLKNDWSLNSKIESRMFFEQGEINGDRNKQFNYGLTDISLIAAKKIGLNSRIAGGYLVRFEEGEVIHRLIQQFVIVQKLSGYRLAHRIMSDQTFSATEAPQFRLRYRISAELPLNGQSVDPGEFYLKLNNEYINSLQARTYDLELRLIPLLGFDFTQKLKIETGIDYRVNSFLNSNTNNSYWMTVNFFVEL